jgi:hypothetical protein
MKSTALTAILLIAFTFVSARSETIVVKGKVTDSADGSTLPGCIVHEAGNSGKGVYTDLNGDSIEAEKEKSQTPKKSITQNDLVARSQNSAANAAGLLYGEIKDFDRECFLVGTMDWDTRNSESLSDTMAYQRVTSYGEGGWHIGLALIVASLFKKDYPDFRALRVCTRCCPPQRYYGSEILSQYDPADPNLPIRDPDARIKIPVFEIELYSSSLEKITAGYYHNGVINREKIATRAQKLSFLAGVFIRYGCSEIKNDNGSSRFSIDNSPSTVAVCSEILKELDCEHVDILPETTQILCMLSADVLKIKRLTYNVYLEMVKDLIIF